MTDADIRPENGNFEDCLNTGRADAQSHLEDLSRRDQSGAEQLDLRNHNVVAIVPAYNEERFIGSVVLMARHFANTIIVIDDGSSDATADVATSAGAKVLKHPINQGKAQALNTAFQAAQDYKPDVVVTLDADGQHCPDELAAIIEPILRREADMVIGSRVSGAHMSSAVPSKYRSQLFQLVDAYFIGCQDHRLSKWFSSVLSASFSLR